MVLFCIPCLALFLYFAIVGIFVPRYRTYYKEAWKCFMDKLSGKKCSVSFDNRMRISLSMWLAGNGFIKMGRWFKNERNFSLFMICFFVITTIISIYLFVVFIGYLQNSPCEINDACYL